MAKYAVYHSSRFDRELNKFDPVFQSHVDKIEEELKDNPYLGKPLTREHEGKFSYKVGTYRVVYKIYEKEKRVFVLTAGHRSTVYQ